MLAINGKDHSINDMAIVLLQSGDKTEPKPIIPFKVLGTNQLKKISSNNPVQATGKPGPRAGRPQASLLQSITWPVSPAPFGEKKK
ncbi:MAG: hypothetical protein PHW60_06140 [Kiritimatiellae bacterium]|nr:hypothetical protein [Kiritimatiellia bacterium]